MTNLFNNINFDSIDESELIEEIPNNFGMELNFSGIKENDIFSMGINYHDSEGGKFNIEAKGKNTEELLENLILKFSKINNIYDKNEEEDNEEYYKQCYEELNEDYDDLIEDYYKIINDYDKLNDEYHKLSKSYNKLYEIYDKVQEILEKDF